MWASELREENGEIVDELAIRILVEDAEQIPEGSRPNAINLVTHLDMIPGHLILRRHH